MDTRLLMLGAASLVLVAALVWTIVSMIRVSRPPRYGLHMPEPSETDAAAVKSDASIDTSLEGLAVEVSPETLGAQLQAPLEIGEWQPAAEPAPMSRLAEVSLASRISARQTVVPVRQAESPDDGGREPVAKMASAGASPEGLVTPGRSSDTPGLLTPRSLAVVVPVVRLEDPSPEPAGAMSAPRPPAPTSAPVAPSPEPVAAMWEAREPMPAPLAPALLAWPIVEPKADPAPEPEPENSAVREPESVPIALAPEAGHIPGSSPGAAVAADPLNDRVLESPEKARSATIPGEAPVRPKAVVKADALGGFAAPAAGNMTAAHLHAEAMQTGVIPFTLAAPVEMWFGDSRVGVRHGTKTWEQFRRYADVLLGDLKEEPESDR